MPKRLESIKRRSDMETVGVLFVIAAPVLLGLANVVEAASSPSVWSCSGDGYECSIRYGRGYCSDGVVCWPEIRLTETSDSMSPSAEGLASVTLERSVKKAEGMEATYRLVCGSNCFCDDGGPSNVSSVVKLRLFRNETILLSLTNAEDSASMELDLWKDAVSLAGPQSRLLPLYFARQSCFRDDGRRMEVRSCLAVGNSKMYYVFRVGEKGECGHVVASADDDHITVLDWFPRSGWTEILSQSENEVSYRNVVYPWADADALSVYRRPLTHAANDSNAGFEVKTKGFGMRLDLDLGKVFKAAKVAVADKPDVRLELGDVVKWW